jgi:hypothetical protein
MNPDTLAPAAQPAYQPAYQPVALELRDIHLPEPVSWWPVAPGWWALLALLVVAIVMFAVLRKVNRNRRLNRLLRDEIRHELETIKQHYHQSANAVMLARELSQLLRRAGISYYSASNIAGLTGDDWLRFLAQTHSNERPKLSFSSDNARTLLTAPYLDDNAQIELDAERLIALCESWLLQKHAQMPDAYSRQSRHDQPQVSSS